MFLHGGISFPLEGGGESVTDDRRVAGTALPLHQSAVAGHQEFQPQRKGNGVSFFRLRVHPFVAHEDFTAPPNGPMNYAKLHTWIASRKKKTGICSRCNRRRFTSWANLSGEYRIDLDDFAEMCSMCHSQYDFSLNARKR